MSLTQTQIIDIFDGMGLNGPPGSPNAAPSAAVIASLEALPGDVYAGLNAIIALPEVQTQVIPILAMFDLAYGHDPISSTLASMVETNLSPQELANAFVDDGTFATRYYNGLNFNHNTIIDSSNSGIITALFLNGLGHPPQASTVEGFFGLTLGQAFLAFVSSNAVAVSPTIDSSLITIMEGSTTPPIPPLSSTLPPPIQSFTLTNGSDTVIAGENTVGTTTPGVPVIQSTMGSPEDTAINAPLGGPFGNQPTLTSGDVIDLSSSVDGNNTLNALFDGSDLLTTLTIKGVQTWNITQTGPGPSTILLEGTPGSIDGLTTLNYNGNSFFGSGLLVGAPGTNGIDPTTSANGFDLNVSNVPGGFVRVFFAPSAFTGGDVINVTANAVGNTLGGTSTSFFNATDIEAGSAGATGGFATWNVKSTGANALNDIALSTNGSKTATTLTVSDDGSSTIIWAGANPNEWAQLTTVDASGTTGNLTITGGESATHGLLADDSSALTSVIAGSGNDLFDLSGYNGTTAQVAGLSILGSAIGTTTIELNNNEINTISTVAKDAFAVWSNVAVLNDVGNGGGSFVGGLVNMADFPGTLNVNLLSDVSNPFGINQDANFNVTNAPDGLTFNFNSTNQAGFDFSVTGTDTTGGAGNVVNIDYTDLANSTGTFTSLNFDNVNVNITDASGSTEVFYTGVGVPFGDPTILVVGNADFNSDVGQGVTFTINATHTGAVPATVLVGDFGIGPGGVGDDSITLLSGPITGLPLHPAYLDTGTLDITGTDNVTIGVTNADVIKSTTTGAFQMFGPDDANAPGIVANWLPYAGVEVSSVSADSLLQGTLGTLTNTADGNWTGTTGSDSLTDTAGDSFFVGNGGGDTIGGLYPVNGDSIDQGNGDNLDYVAGIFSVDNTNHGQTITDIVAGNEAAFQGSWGVGGGDITIASASTPTAWINGAAGVTSDGANSWGTSADMTTITGFTVGPADHDTVEINSQAWAGGGTGVGKLVNGGGGNIAAGDSVMNLEVGAGGVVLGNTDVVLYNVSGLTNAASLAAALASNPGGIFTVGAISHNEHMLFAYQSGSDVRIADVDFVNGVNGIHFTGGQIIIASDLVDLQNVSLVGLGSNHADVHFLNVHG